MLSTLLCLHTLLPAAVQEPQLEVGETVEHRFERAPRNALGVTRLSDLRGVPVLVAFFNGDSWADDWVTDVLLWQEGYGSDLAVVLAEIPSHGDAALEAQVLKKKWLEGRALWTTEAPAFPGLVGTPQYCLLSARGEVVAFAKSATVGMNFDSRELDVIGEAIAREVRAVTEGPGGEAKAVARCYQLFARGELDAAYAQARELALHDQADVPERARAAIDSFDLRLARRLTRAEALLEAGRLAELEADLAGLAGKLAAEEAQGERIARLVVALGAPQRALELEASRALAKLEATLRDRGPRTATLRKVESFARKYEGTASAARARRLLELAEG